MTDYLPRSAWTSTSPGGSTMQVAEVVGCAVHWPADPGAFGLQPAHNIARVLAAYRAFHVGPSRNYSDIAYQVAFDQNGRVWELRGINRRSGANGGTQVNRTWGAALFLVGPGEEPSPSLLAAWRHWRNTRWLARYPRAAAVRGHQDVRPGGGTACPGSIVQRLIDAGTLTTAPPATEEEDTLSALAEGRIEDYLDAPVSMAAGHAKSASANTSRVLVQLTALTAAVEALAESKGADAQTIANVVDKAVRDKLANLVVDIAEPTEEKS